MYNKIILIGRLGKDPKLAHTPSGVAYCKFSMATSDSYKKGDDWQEETQWHNVILWRGSAERAAEKLKKGSLIFVEGKVIYRTWETDDGQKRFFTEIDAKMFRMMESKGGGSSTPPASEPPPDFSIDEDVPF